MFPSKEKRMQLWVKTRAKGMRRFIIVNGVLGWGVTSAILFSLFMWLSSVPFNPFIQVPIALILFPLFGILWGSLVWRVTEKEFLAFSKSHAS